MERPSWCLKLWHCWKISMGCWFVEENNTDRIRTIQYHSLIRFSEKRRRQWMYHRTTKLFSRICINVDFNNCFSIIHCTILNSDFMTTKKQHQDCCIYKIRAKILGRVFLSETTFFFIFLDRLVIVKGLSNYIHFYL